MDIITEVAIPIIYAVYGGVGEDAVQYLVGEMENELAPTRLALGLDVNG
jgi:hypothetical protein